MRLGPFEFTPSLVPSIAALLITVLTIFLGRWQLNRAEEKRTLQQRYEAVQSEASFTLTGRENEGARLQFRQLTAAGEFDPARQIFLDNQVYGERAGYHVLTPLKLADGKHYVLVNRGWVARGPEYPAPPEVEAPRGTVTVRGQGALPLKRFLELSADTVQGNVWQNVTFERYRQATRLDILSIVLVQTTGNAEGLTPVRERPDFGIAKHEGYAFQWYSLSAVLVAIYLYTNTRYLKK